MLEELQKILADPFSASLAEKVVVGVCVIIITYVAQKLLGNFVHRVLRHDEVDIPANSVLVNIVRGVVIFLGIAFLLQMCFHLDVTAMVAGLGVVGIAVSLGMQDTLSDFISGVLISLNGVVVSCDYVRVNGVNGKVLDVNWRETKILDVDVHVHIIPNSTISNQEIIHLNEVEPVTVTLLLPFFDTPEEIEAHCAKLKEVATEAASALVELKRETVVAYTGSNYAGVEGVVKVYIEVGSIDPRKVTSAVMKAVAPYTSREAC